MGLKLSWVRKDRLRLWFGCGELEVGEAAHLEELGWRLWDVGVERGGWLCWYGVWVCDDGAWWCALLEACIAATEARSLSVAWVL